MPDYRPMHLSDAPSVAALVRAAFAAQSVPTDPPASALRVTAEDITIHLAKGGGAVAQAGDELAGSALWIEKEGGLYIGRVAIAVEWRRQGIARRLLAMAEDAARAAGLPHLWLETRLPLIDNRHLFASIGFMEISQHSHPGYTNPTFVRMRKPLQHAPV